MFFSTWTLQLWINIETLKKKDIPETKRISITWATHLRIYRHNKHTCTWRTLHFRVFFNIKSKELIKKPNFLRLSLQKWYFWLKDSISMLLHRRALLNLTNIFLMLYLHLELSYDTLFGTLEEPSKIKEIGRCIRDWWRSACLVETSHFKIFRHIFLSQMPTLVFMSPKMAFST